MVGALEVAVIASTAEQSKYASHVESRTIVHSAGSTPPDVVSVRSSFGRSA